MRSVADQTILITGATDGLGQAVAAELAAAGARLLLHGRDDRKGADTVREIQDRTGNRQVHWYAADLSSLRATADLAQQVMDTCGRLDALVDNAGIGFTEPGGGRRVQSEDGHELRFAVNYLAPYLLTRQLMPLLRRSAPSRVVNVASAGQEPIDFADVMLEHREIAGLMGCPIGTVMSRLHRGRGRLRELLTERLTGCPGQEGA
jgi:NAD(P)-dependent dehydrogenase (short-subunit alcohol dehydrogenase family)